MNDYIKITINGKEIQASKGETILSAALNTGIDIPRLCHIEGLNPPANCRLCVVELGNGKIVPSCATPVTRDMEVQTHSERVVKARKMVMELLLSDHPFDCMTCEKSGDCKLEKYAYELGITSTSYEGETHSYPLDNSNPFFIRDYNKCILCEQCVKACSEVQFVNAIEVANRSFDSKVSAPYDRSLVNSACIFCGQCVAACPVGALVEKNRLSKGREWELKKVSTICPYCGVGCNIDLNIKNNTIVKVTSRHDSSVNRGRLCVKGRFGLDFVNNPERLTTPLIRTGERGEGKFREAGWDEALDLVASKLSAIRDESGADSMAFLSSAKCTNEENYLLQKLARAVVGTNNIDHCARL